MGRETVKKKKKTPHGRIIMVLEIPALFYIAQGCVRYIFADEIYRLNSYCFVGIPLSFSNVFFFFYNKHYV